MPPLSRILLGCWAVSLTGIALAEGRLPSGYPAPPTRLDWESRQQSFAQQYLAVPPGETSHANRPESGRPVAHFDDTAPVDFPNRTAPATEPETDFQRAPEATNLPATGDAPAGAPGTEAAGSFSEDMFDPPVSEFTAPSVDQERPQPPQLLPAPSLPAKPIPSGPQPPEPGKLSQRGESRQVVPVTHVSEDVSGSGDDVVEPEQPDRGGPDAASSAGAPHLLQPREAMPLEPPATTGSEGSRRRAGRLPSMVTIGGGLAVVLGIFFLVAWGMRRAAPGVLTTLPRQVVEVLGRTSLAGRQQVHLVRCGNKLLLVSVTPDAVETLTEITDPMEVDRLAGLCEQANPNSSSAAFRRVLQQFAHEGKGTHAT